MKMKMILPMMLIAALPLGADAQNKSGLVMSNLDQTVKPADSFYQFATGGWQKNNPLPAAYSRYGSFERLAENNNKRINTILSELQKKTYKAGTIEQKLSDFYKLSMDVDSRNKAGIAPVKPLMDEIEAAKTKDELQKLQVKYAWMGLGLSYGAGFAADEKNVTMNIYNLMQGGLTLGAKDYYLNNDAATVAIREAYKSYLSKMFQLYGFSADEAAKKASAVFLHETTLATFSKSRTELRDPQANYNKMTLAEFKENYPNIPLEALANAEGIKSEYLKEMIVGQPAFFAGYDKVAAAECAGTLKALMEWDIICSSASYLSDEISEARFEFFGKIMSGRKEDYPLWKRATVQVEAQLGEALGSIYCKRYFPESSKKMMETLVKNLQISLGQRIDAQTWMSDATKKAAHNKLDKFYVKIGYPNKWTDFSKLSIDPSKSYYENVMACRKFANDKEIAEKAGKPVDRDEWFMTPQTVNAYYNPTTNEICFPAGILQYPFFDPKADAAFNYGAIGVVIGHEMTHGFDDQGRQYDKDGNLKDWWTAEDAKNFDERAQVMVNFFDSIQVAPGVYANGRMTLGENIADHGGLQVSYNAFKKATAANPLPVMEGFTPEQRFFLAYAGVWANDIRPEEVLNRTKSDVHSLGIWRVNGALPHIGSWYEAFNVTEKDPMFVPVEKRVSIW